MGCSHLGRRGLHRPQKLPRKLQHRYFVPLGIYAQRLYLDGPCLRCGHAGRPGHQAQPHHRARSGRNHDRNHGCHLGCAEYEHRALSQRLRAGRCPCGPYVHHRGVCGCLSVGQSVCRPVELRRNGLGCRQHPHRPAAHGQRYAEQHPVQQPRVVRRLYRLPLQRQRIPIDRHPIVSLGLPRSAKGE